MLSTEHAEPYGIMFPNQLNTLKTWPYSHWTRFHQLLSTHIKQISICSL